MIAALALVLALTTPPAHPHPPARSSVLVPYTVQHGDTLWSIAQRFYGNGRWWSTFARDTPSIVTARQLHAGQILAVRLNG